MNLLIITEVIEPHVIRIIKFFQKQSENKIHLLLCSSSSFEPDNVFNDMNNLQIYNFLDIVGGGKKLPGISFLSNLYKLRWVINKKIKPDSVLLLSAINIMNKYVVFLGLKKLVVFCLGTDIIPRKTDIVKLNKIDRLLRYILLYKSYKIILFSNYMKKFLRQIINKDSVIISTGVDTNSIKKNINIKKSKEQIIIGFVKDLREYYGIYFLLNVIIRLKQKYNNIELHILASGTEEQQKKLTEIIKKNNAEGYIKFIGYIANNQLSDYLSKFDIFVNPTLIDESLGINCLEAASAGLPVVAADIGGIPETIIDKKTGLLFKANDADDCYMKIEQLIIDEDFREKLGLAARRFIVNKYDIKIEMNKMKLVLT